MALSQLWRLFEIPSERLDPDSYVTDGERLLRVVSDFETGPDPESGFTSLEDCLTLEVRHYSLRELNAMGLQTVRTPDRPDSMEPGSRAPTQPCDPTGDVSATLHGRSARIALHVSRSGQGWDVVLPEHGQLITCETLDDARRVAYLCGARAQPCELIVLDRDHVHSELIGGDASDG